MKKIKENLYSWMVANLPFKWMYHKIPYSQGYIWRPRWGWSQAQLDRAEIFSKRMMKNIKWEDE